MRYVVPWLGLPSHGRSGNTISATCTVQLEVERVAEITSRGQLRHPSPAPALAIDSALADTPPANQSAPRCRYIVRRGDRDGDRPVLVNATLQRHARVTQPGQAGVAQLVTRPMGHPARTRAAVMISSRMPSADNAEAPVRPFNTTNRPIVAAPAGRSTSM